MLVHHKISYLKPNQHLLVKKKLKITIAIGTGCNNVCLCNFLLFGIDNQSRVNNFEQIKSKERKSKHKSIKTDLKQKNEEKHK